MALNWMRTAKITRDSGASAVRGAAYRSGTKLVEERAANAAAYRSGSTISGEQRTHDYSRKDGVLHSEILAPEHTPKHLLDRATLWNEADRVERYRNAQIARDWLFPLPSELSYEQNLAMIRDHVRERFVARGMVADLNVHEPSWRSKQTDSPNLHAHVMTTTRDIRADGTWGPKSQGSVSREWQGPAFVAAERQAWQDRQNATFETLGLSLRVVDGERRISPQAVAEREAADRERAEAFGAPVPEEGPDRREERRRALKGQGASIAEPSQPKREPGDPGRSDRPSGPATRGETRRQLRDIRDELDGIAGQARAIQQRATERIAAIRARRKYHPERSAAYRRINGFERWIDDPLKQFLTTWERMDRADARRRGLRRLERSKAPMRPATAEELSALRAAKMQHARAGALLDHIDTVRQSVDRMPANPGRDAGVAAAGRSPARAGQDFGR